MFDTARSRIAQVARILTAEGAEGAVRRARKLGHRVLGEQAHELPLLAADVADSTELGSFEFAEPVRVEGRPLRIGWITTPPGAGSGGHTTMFRMIEGLERAGHDVSLYLYDTSHSDVARHERVIRQNWAGVRATVRTVDAVDVDADVWIATSWQTAHVLASRPHLAGRRMYFVQDYEPYFYARGALYALAEDTYRFGFTGITAGAWLAEELEQRFGMRSTHFDFGADLNIYSATSGSLRPGVVFYTKPTVARRGHETGMLALEKFARARPDATIHLFGDPVPHVPFDAVNHGRQSLEQLNALYNICRVGLSLSFTNVSLIPWELLASGVVPVVNDARHNRLVLRSDGVVWSNETPAALARAMQQAYDDYDIAASPPQLAASVAGASWAQSADAVAAFIESETFYRA